MSKALMVFAAFILLSSGSFAGRGQVMVEPQAEAGAGGAVILLETQSGEEIKAHVPKDEEKKLQSLKEGENVQLRSIGPLVPM